MITSLLDGEYGAVEQMRQVYEMSGMENFELKDVPRVLDRFKTSCYASSVTPWGHLECMLTQTGKGRRASYSS